MMFLATKYMQRLRLFLTFVISFAIRLSIVDFVEDPLKEAAGGCFDDFAASFDSFPDLPEDFVPGRVSKPEFLSFWKTVLKPDPETLSIVEEGYRVPFLGGKNPPASFEPNNKSALFEAGLPLGIFANLGAFWLYNPC